MIRARSCWMVAACAWSAMVTAGCGSGSGEPGAGAQPDPGGGGAGGVAGAAGDGGSGAAAGQSAGGSGGGGASGTAGSPPSCQSPKALCAQACVDTSSDPAHCGACGHDCLGAPCAQGLCAAEKLGSGKQNPSDFVVDAGAVYYLAFASGSVPVLYRQPFSGDPAAVLASDAGKGSRLLRLAGGTAYWAAESVADPKRDELRALPLAGGSVKTVALTPYEHMKGLGVTSAHAYFLLACSNVYKVPLSGGTPAALEEHGCNVWGDLAFGVDPADTFVYATFLTKSKTTELWKLDAAAGGITKLSTDLPVSEIAVSGDRLLLASKGTCVGSTVDPECSGGKILSLPAGGGSPSTLVDMSTLLPALKYKSLGSIVVDAASLFFQVTEVKGASMAIYEVSTSGGAPLLVHRISKPSSGIRKLGVDGKHAYFVDGDLSLSRVAR